MPQAEPNKVYIGNVPTQMTEQSLRGLLEDNGVTATSIQLKRGGYAFVNVSDQNQVDTTIEKLNNCCVFGNILRVEPSIFSKAKKESSPQLVISNFTSSEKWPELERVLNECGSVLNIEKEPFDSENGAVITVTYLSSEEAREALRAVSSNDSLSSPNVTVTIGQSDSIHGDGYSSSRRGNMAANPKNNAEIPLSLRIMVPSDMVGAIIGKEGKTIKEISTRTHARVDVHRKENSTATEKCVTIYGQPDNCSAACKEIIRLMREEAQAKGKTEPPLKILCHNNLVGRIIGKSGNIINKIKQDTDTKITVNSMNELTAYNFERVITISGELDNVCEAERMISAKIRQSSETDWQVMNWHQLMMPGNVGMMQHPFTLAAAPPAMMPGFFGAPMNALPAQQETVYLYVPNNSVGAIIGTSGSHIRSIIRLSNASVKIEPKEEEPSSNDPNRDRKVNVRRVTIVGSGEAQYRAQYYIFEKIRNEGYLANGDGRLLVEIAVPTALVGRIIGKAGKNVREIQRTTGAQVKVFTQQSSDCPATQGSAADKSYVSIFGHFLANQSAQRRVQSIVQQAIRSAAGGDARRPRPPSVTSTN